MYDVLANDDYYASSYQRQRYDDLQSASGSVDLVSTDGSSEGSPNCVLLTANWIAGTRYQLDCNMTNPTGGRGSEASVYEEKAEEVFDWQIGRKGPGRT